MITTIGTRIKLWLGKWGVLLALLLVSHSLVYWKGRVDEEREILNNTVAQLTTDVKANAERVETQVAKLTT